MDNDQLLENEARLLIAPETNDVAELDHLLHEDLLFTDHQGRLIRKALDLKVHRSGQLLIEWWGLLKSGFKSL